jgi:hypothetical protein
MTLEIIQETDAAQQQLDLYNKASQMVKQKTYNVNAGLTWVVVGLVLADTATPADEQTLVDAITALPEVTLVADPRFWGQTPASLLINPDAPADPTHEALLCTEARVAGQIGYGGDVRSFSETQFESLAPPLNKKWLVCNLVLPAPLSTEQMITDLETALEGVTGITTAEHLIGGTIPANASGTQIVITTRMRIDPVPTP